METRIVFFGNSKYSVIDAKALFERFGLSAVVTLPDRTGSRGKKEVSPVKLFAQETHIPCVEASKLTHEIIEKIKTYRPDFLVVADYGLILPRKLLQLPMRAALNVHHSLLPKYRGPSPAPAAILNGDTETGVSIITMNEKVDAGDILKQVRYTLSEEETTDSLLTRLNELGGKAVVEAIEDYLADNAQPKKQDESLATSTSYMSPTDGLIDLSGDPVLNWRKIRAYGEWPGTYFMEEHKGVAKKVKITEAVLQGGKLIIKTVIPQNKREMRYEDFLRGLQKS